MAAAHLRAIRGGKGEPYVASMVAQLARMRELSPQMVEYLAALAQDGEEKTKHRVAAARAFLHYHIALEDRFGEAPPPMLPPRSAREMLSVVRGALPELERRAAAEDGRELPELAEKNNPDTW